MVHRRLSEMKTLSTAIVTTFLLLAGAEWSFAKEWRGLSPLRSTRADVVRLFNKCNEQKEACAFRLGNENVYILFSGGLPAKFSECAQRLPPETIMFIDVEFKTPRSFKTLRLDKKNFITFNPSEPRKMGLKGYWNEEDGLLINTLRGKVIQLEFLPTALDRFQCATFYYEPESFIAVIVNHYSALNVDCPTRSPKTGEKIVCSADGNVNASRGYTWTVTGGRIISGQLTDRITVDTTGVAGQTIVVTAEHRDVFGHVVIASCRVPMQTE